MMQAAGMRVYEKIVRTSNAYYNRALAQTKVRDLTGAAENLRRGLRFNKQNIMARNLLGLVYFEMGETVMALREWVISKNFQPENNIAGDYLTAIQKNKSRLESINQTIKKYNQALLYCRQDSKDLAVIQLKKVLTMNPKLVRGYQLLALLYLEEGNVKLAKKALDSAYKIDAGNTLTLRYLQEVNSREQESPEKEKEKKVISYQSGNETIIRPTTSFRENSGGSTVLNIVIGLVIGALITCFLIVPGVKQSATSNAKKEVLEANDALSTKSQELKNAESKVEELEKQIADEKSNADSADGKVASYQQLLSAYASYQNGDVTAAGDALANIKEEDLDEASASLYNEVNAQVNSEYLSSLYQEAYQNYNRRNYEEAITGFEKIMEMDEQYHDGYALYYLAQAYRKVNDVEHARTYYQKVVDLYPHTERASTASQYLNELESANPEGQ